MCYHRKRLSTVNHRPQDSVPTPKYNADTVPVQSRLSHHFAMAKQGSCLRCGRSRSSHARHMPQNSALHNLVCSRRACAEARSLLRRASSFSAIVGTMVVEIYYYHHVDHAAGGIHTAARISEFQAENPHRSWAELPSELYTSHSASQGQNRLPTILEEPPYVDVSSKPSADAVRVVLSRKGW
jgi:hypothetical protein